MTSGQHCTHPIAGAKKPKFVSCILFSFPSHLGWHSFIRPHSELEQGVKHPTSPPHFDGAEPPAHLVLKQQHMGWGWEQDRTLQQQLAVAAAQLRWQTVPWEIACVIQRQPQRAALTVSKINLFSITAGVTIAIMTTGADPRKKN